MPSVHFGLIVLYGVENAGVRYVASTLRERGHRATLVFFKEWANNAVARPTEAEKGLLVEILRDRGVEVAGFSFGSSYFRIASDLAQHVREELGLPIVFGGAHATVMPEACVEVADYVCVGEGAKIAAHAVVLTDVPPHSTFAGVPARMVGHPASDQPALEMDHRILRED